MSAGNVVKCHSGLNTWPFGYIKYELGDDNKQSICSSTQLIMKKLNQNGDVKGLSCLQFLLVLGEGSKKGY